MSYLVLARKYRPQAFDDLLGQEHISSILKKAVQTGKTAQAYLFCGPRGVGKTSCARIMAKALNCQQGPTLNPCGECSACREISGGSGFDVLEIDGASNRGIDEIRSLRENVKFAPGYGRFKIYIVDEVHMLTTEAFNALLKTLEEPPEHVKFIFATTEPNKVPATIISRCQRFDFRSISLEGIRLHLSAICQQEQVALDEDALFAIAKAAQGSLRDALGILDQLSALSDDTIRSADVFSMLGIVETDLLFDLADGLARADYGRCLEVIEQTTRAGKDIRQLTRDLTEHFRNLMILKVGGKGLGRLVDYPIAVKERLLDQSGMFSLSAILEVIQTLLEARDVMRSTEMGRLPLEVGLAKLIYTETRVAGEQAALSSRPRGTADPSRSQPKKNKQGPRPGHGEAPQNLGPPASHQTAPREQQRVVSKKEGSTGEPQATVASSQRQKTVSKASLTIETIRRTWDQLTHAISQHRMSVATYLQEGIPYQLEENVLTIAFKKDLAFHRHFLEDDNHRRLVEDVLAKQLGQKITIQYVLSDQTPPPAEEDDSVQSALETFGGEVVSRWHND